MNAGHQREALRQQLLLRALWRDAPTTAVQGWLRGTPQARRRGLQACQANAGALAERALAAAFPTVAQLLGDEAMAGLARAFWRADAPVQGDLATWGAGLPQFMAVDPQLAAEPYLADVARLDWALHRAAGAADDDAPPAGLDLLATADPATLRLQLRAGHAVLQSAHPVHTLWAAHQDTRPDRFAPVRAALAAGQGEALRVRRQGLQPVAERISAADAGFEQALLHGRSLATALHAAGTGFDFEAWFITTLQHGSLAAVLRIDEDNA